jgi:hypothetical protein
MQTFRAMKKHKDENQVIKLWHQLVTNNFLVVHLFEFMKLIELAIVQIIDKLKMKRHIHVDIYEVAIL